MKKGPPISKLDQAVLWQKNSTVPNKKNPGVGTRYLALDYHPSGFSGLQGLAQYYSGLVFDLG